MFENLSAEERMERRSVVPHFGVKFIAFQAEGGLGEFKAFIRTNLNRSAEWKKELEKDKAPQQER